MGWLDRIVHGFIMTFGITQPSEENRRRANLFIGALLLLVLSVFVGLIAFGLRAIVQ